MNSLRGDPHTTVLPATSSLPDQGLSLFLSRTDKTWTVTDCISFAVMHEQNLTEALTTDHHFAQAGFTVLLK